MPMHTPPEKLTAGFQMGRYAMGNEEWTFNPALQLK